MSICVDLSVHTQHGILLSDPESGSSGSRPRPSVPGSLRSIVVQSKATEVNE